MDTPRPALKKRITISRWGPALDPAEKAANIEASQMLPNGTGSDNREVEEKVVCHIVKVNKGSNYMEKLESETKSLSKSSDEDRSSSDSSVFLGFEDCDLDRQIAFNKVLDRINREQQCIESEGTSGTGWTLSGHEPNDVDAEVENMTVDTRPDEDDETDVSLDKSNSDDMEIDDNKGSDDNSLTNVTETVQQKREGKTNEEHYQDVDKISEDKFTIKEEVLSIHDYGERDDLDDKLPATPSGSENDFSGSLTDSHSESTTASRDFSDIPGKIMKKKTRTKENGHKIKKTTVDISNPAYLKPFDFGWKRELVYRSTNDTQNRRQSDVYYYTPKGKKVRSFREVTENLVGQDLSIDNFTFFKEAIGIEDPEKEIIRDAKLKLKDTSFSSPSPILKKTLLPKTPKSPKLSPTTSEKEKQPTKENESSTPPVSGTTTKSVTPRVVFRGGKKLGSFGSGQKFTATQSKNNVPGQAKKIIISKGKRNRKKSEEELEMGMLPPMWQPKEKVTKGREKEPTVVKISAPASGGKPMEVCNIRCPLAMGLIPTLQCHVCLCLYHPECVGLEEAINRTIHSYKCKNCQLAPAKPSTIVKTPVTINSAAGVLAPPPLTPISTLNSVNSSHSQFGHMSVNNPPPKLTRLTDGKIVTVPRTVSKPPATKAQSIVGGVTTWLPPSSTIQLSPSAPKLSPAVKNSTPATTSTVDSAANLPVQTLITMNGKRFVVVPKHNILSVSPTVTAPSISVADPSGTQITTSGEISPSLTTLTTQTYGSGVPILPKPTPTSGATFLVSSPATPTTAFQNPPGVLLVPYLAPQTSQQAKDGVQQPPQPQYVIVNGPSGLQAGNFLFGNLQQQQLKLPAIPTSQAAEPPAE